jgi:esterase/lipase
LDALVTLSAPYDLPNGPSLRKIIPILRLLSWIKPFLKKPQGGDWFNPQAGQEHFSYPYNPTRSVVELLLMLKAMQASLPAVSAPALLIHSLDDRYVHPANILPIFAQLGSPRKDMEFIQGASHCVTIDGDRYALFERIVGFLKRNCPPDQK